MKTSRLNTINILQPRRGDIYNNNNNNSFFFNSSKFLDPQHFLYFFFDPHEHRSLGFCFFVLDLFLDLFSSLLSRPTTLLVLLLRSTRTSIIRFLFLRLGFFFGFIFIGCFLFIFSVRVSHVVCVDHSAGTKCISCFFFCFTC